EWTDPRAGLQYILFVSSELVPNWASKRTRARTICATLGDLDHVAEKCRRPAGGGRTAERFVGRFATAGADHCWIQGLLRNQFRISDECYRCRPCPDGSV